jgi:hypothetical protein
VRYTLVEFILAGFFKEGDLLFSAGNKSFNVGLVPVNHKKRKNDHKENYLYRLVRNDTDSWQR